MGGVIISWLFFFANLNKIRVAETGKRGQGKDKEGLGGKNGLEMRKSRVCRLGDGSHRVERSEIATRNCIARRAGGGVG